MKLSAYPSAPKSLRRNAVTALIIGIFVFLMAYFAGFTAEFLTDAFSAPETGSSSPELRDSLIPSLVLGLLVGGNILLLLSCKVKHQMMIVWAELLVLFLLFFYSFDLEISFILEKLPFLLTRGVTTTLYVSLISIVVAFTLALIGSISKLSDNGIAMGIASFYTSFFRGVPLLAQLFLIYLGLPQIGIIVDPVPAGIAALSLCYGAYMTEIFRAGMQSIEKGQWEAAAALGLQKALAFRKVVLPQAFKIIIPPTGNSFIAMLKDSSLVSVVGVWDLMYVARAQGRADFRILEMLITAALIYWILSIMLELVQSRLERHFSKAVAH
ncbi:amino acid ABC transporter permease [Roseibium sp. SCP14]|uniref:amino acid ABC transporter permease n=1 Tax=Roseibium sp. SCP14 TaxID=3141375 RepID=UPI003337F8E9